MMTRPDPVSDAIFSRNIVMSVLMHRLVIAVVIPAYKAGRFLIKTIERVSAKTLLQWEYRTAGEGTTNETPSWLVSTEIRHRQRPLSLIFVEFEAICTKVAPVRLALNGRGSRWRPR